MTTPNGCHNRAPLRETQQVQDGWVGWVEAWGGVSRAPFMKTIPAPMSKDCVYSKSAPGNADPRCEGCRWKAAA